VIWVPNLEALYNIQKLSNINLVNRLALGCLQLSPIDYLGLRVSRKISNTLLEHAFLRREIRLFDDQT